MQDYETESQRRERILVQVRSWCDGCRIDGSVAAPLDELSDDAAVLIAAAYLDDSTRAILANRRRAGRSTPSVGGFGGLRRLADERWRLEAKAAAQAPGALQALSSLRVAEAVKRIDVMRAAFVSSGGHYANTLRTIRRDRRAGIHLDPIQREALFDALQCTPTPHAIGAFDKVRQSAFSSAAGRITTFAQNTRFADTGRRIAESLAGSGTADTGTFTDRFDTLLYLAGALFDRVDGSPAWQSEYFAVQRVQLDLADELIQIAVDTVALRDIDGELRSALGRALLDSARSQVQDRLNALVPVWDQLVARVAALARIGDLLAKAEDQLRSAAAVQHSQSLDARIDDLIARSGNRELSAANTHFVGDQLDGVDRLMIGYQTVLFNDIRALTERGSGPATGT